MENVDPKNVSKWNNPIVGLMVGIHQLGFLVGSQRNVKLLEMSFCVGNKGAF